MICPHKRFLGLVEKIEQVGSLCSDVVLQALSYPMSGFTFKDDHIHRDFTLYRETFCHGNLPLGRARGTLRASVTANVPRSLYGTGCQGIGQDVPVTSAVSAPTGQKKDNGQLLLRPPYPRHIAAGAVCP